MILTHLSVIQYPNHTQVLTEANITFDDLRLAGYVIDDSTMLPLPPPNYIDTTPVEPLPEPEPEPEPEPSEPTFFELLVGMSYPQQIHTLKGVLEPLIKVRGRAFSKA